MYVQETGQKDPDVKHFLKWQISKSSCTLNLMFQLVFKFALRIYIQRIGGRNNDAAVSDAGRFAFMDMFYGFRHPIYQEIEYRDLKNKVLYPIEVKIQRKQSFSFSLTKEIWRCQGGDFMLEKKVCVFFLFNKACLF